MGHNYGSRDVQIVTSARTPIDAALRRFLDETVPAVPILQQPTDAARVEAARALMLQTRNRRVEVPGLPNRVETREATIGDGLTGRMYIPPDGIRPLPALVYAHGGGWVVGSVETHDPFCRLLSEAAGVIILSIEFRRAPEHPFPAALDDMLAAYRWAAAHAESFGGDAKRLMLGGDSAGGNLAAVAANRICAADEVVHPAGLMLLYPVTDHPGASHDSYTENATGYGLEASVMRFFWEQYASGVSPDDTNISPLRLHAVPSLPPTLVATAEYDPLRDDGIAYAEKLAKAGVAVTHMHAPDMHHNFPVHPGTVARFPQCVAALDGFAQWIRATVKQR
jgi:acetyl esterase